MKREEETSLDFSSVPPEKQGKKEQGKSSSDREMGENDHVKSLLKDKLLKTQSAKSQSMKENKQIEDWYAYAKSSGYAGEIVLLTDEHSPFLYEGRDRFPESALVVYVINEHSYSDETGPFRPVRLIIFPDGSWRLQCTIYEFKNVAEGQLNSANSADLIALVSKWFTSSHMLCPGLLGFEGGLYSKNNQIHGKPRQECPFSFL